MDSVFLVFCTLNCYTVTKSKGVDEWQCRLRACMRECAGAQQSVIGGLCLHEHLKCAAIRHFYVMCYLQIRRQMRFYL